LFSCGTDRPEVVRDERLEAGRQAVPESDAEEVERCLKRSVIGIALQRPSPKSRCVVNADIFVVFREIPVTP
jgi:hypothetical protein